MGRTVTPTFRIEARDNWGKEQIYVWKTEQYGRPTEANLDKWRQSLNGSFQPNGINWHASVTVGYVIRIISAKVIRQLTGETVVETHAPAFEVA